MRTIGTAPPSLPLSFSLRLELTGMGKLDLVACGHQTGPAVAYAAALAASTDRSM